MELASLLQRINSHYKQHLPFILYSLPNKDSIKVCLQNDDTLYGMDSHINESFIFAPFDYNKNPICIPLEKGETFTEAYLKKEVDHQEVEIKEEAKTREKYIKSIKNAISVIKNRNAIKIVISRKKEIKLKQFDLKVLINRLLNLYPNAFRYVWYHPKTGLWCGASPELLVKSEGPSFITMALAGTQKYEEGNNPIWHHKEREEQQIVVDAISTSLQKVTSVVKISKSYTYRAASIVHLRSDITVILKKGKTTLSSIVSALHPTPAVCGAPQKFAKKYILNNEDYNREFYTGFLGPICESESCSELYVNLRCMKIENNIASLFVGGGITIASDPESEWEETEHKLQTMLQVIQPMV